MDTLADSRITFRPRARLLALLGEQLISDQAVGLIELVKNAYDADATTVSVELSGLTAPETTQILIHDNGFGMTRDDILQKWLSPAIDHKERQKRARQRSARGRLPIGEKGVGRFAVHQLGRRLTLITRAARAPEVVLQVNWDDFDSGEQFLGDVAVALSTRDPLVFPDSATGTRLLVDGARTPWTETLIGKVQRALRRLQSPHASASDFRIALRCPEFPAYESIDSSDILDHAHYRFRGQVSADGKLDYEYRCLHPALLERAETRDDVPLAPIAGRELATPGANGCGPFHVTFYVWDRTAEHLTRSGVARADLDAMAGVSLFRDGLRVLPYGESGNDWLDLDRERINDPSRRIGNQQIIGFVEVQQTETPGLRDKTNREGLIDNPAFRDLRALVRAAITELTTQWQRDRPKPDTRPRAPQSALQTARTVASALVETARDDVVVQVRQSTTPASGTGNGTTAAPDAPPAPIALPPSPGPNPPSPYLTQRQAAEVLVEQLQQASRYQEQIEADAATRQELLMHLAATGMAAERVAHEFGRQVHAALEAMGQLRALGRGDGEVAQAIQTLNACLGTLRNEFRVLAPYEAGWRLQRTTDHPVREAASLALALNEHLIAAAGITATITGDDFTVVARPASLIQVIDNLVHNACIWLEGHAGPRRLTIAISRATRTLTVVDTGPGVPEHLHAQIFEPFISRRNGGRGLGLYITRELLRPMRATITLLPRPANRSGATFVVQFADEADTGHPSETDNSHAGGV